MRVGSCYTTRFLRRRGSAYALVLMTSMLVVVIGLAALTTTRVQTRTVSELEASVAARQLARSAVELGMFMVRQNPYWRTEYGEGVWRNWTSLGDAIIRVEAHDPVDSDPDNNYDDPIVLRGSARVGDASHTVEATMDATRGSELLELALHASGDVQATGALLSADNWISSSANFLGNVGAHFYADVSAGINVLGATYHGIKLTAQPARPAIPITNIVAAYATLATTIDITALPAGTANKVRNSGFESATSAWSTIGNTTTIVLDGTRRRSGSFSLRVNTRTAPSDGIEQDVTATLRNQKPFAASAYVRRAGTVNADPQLKLVISYKETPASAATVVTYTSAAVTVSTAFLQVPLNVTPSWTGTLQSAKLCINTATSIESLNIDDVSLARTDLTNEPYIEGVVLSAGSNPFGDLNANGVYLINCGDQNVHIRDCRIHGTLVLQSPGSASVIEQSVTWRPYVENYPILVTNAGMLISMSNTPLSESTINANFNPAIAPANDEGLGSDLDLYDSYASQLRGLIVLGGNSSLGGRNDIFGVLLCDGILSVEAMRTDITYDVRYLNDPPPGLDSVERTVEFRRGSFRQATN